MGLGLAILVVIATPEITSKPLETETISFILGDVNEDGNIDASDALMILKIAAKII